MPKGPTMAQLKKLLFGLPVKERQAIIRRAKLRSVEKQIGQKDEQFQQDIICRLSKQDSEIFDATSKELRHRDCATYPEVSRGKKVRPENIPAGPVNNFPSYDYDGGAVDAVTLEIFSLRRRNAELSAKVAGLNNKLTLALEFLYSMKRFLQLWVNEGQGETYDQIHARMRRLESTIAHIEDRTIGPAPELTLPERWKRKP